MIMSKRVGFGPRSFCTVFAALQCAVLVMHAKDWPTFGRDPSRNAVSPKTNPPTAWVIKVEPGKSEWKPGLNIKWLARLGNTSFSTPVVAKGYVWIGTNNGNPRDPDVREDAAVLMCFREADGEFVWQYVVPRKYGVRSDWQNSGIKCSPTIDGDLMWFTTPGADVVCLDLSPLQHGGHPRALWKLDLQEFGVIVHPNPMGWGGATAMAVYQDRIYVNTGNGVEWDHRTVAHPDAPSLICLEKRTGNLVWSDNSPGDRIFHEQWSAPLIFEMGRTAHVVSGFGDGFLRCFAAKTGRLEWSADCNPADYRAKRYPDADGPSEILAAPMYAQGRVYVTIGHDPEHGEGLGNLVCVDAATGRMIWENHTIQRSLSTPVRVRERLFVADLTGYVYCFDAQTGALRWRFDAAAHVWASPLYVDGRLFIGDEDGKAMVFDLEAWEQSLAKNGAPLLLKSPQPHLVSENNVGGPLYTQQVFVNGVLYINAGTYLCAISRTGPVAKEAAALALKVKVPDTTFASTATDVVEKMLEMARLTASDTLYDLGSGDGRIIVAAARKYGCRAVGYEIDPSLVQRSSQAVQQSNLERLARIEQQDLFTADLREADVLALYLPSPILKRLIPRLKQLKPGARIVSHEFVIPGVQPDTTVRMISSEDGAEHVIHLWTAPLKDLGP
jgi:outer membrane protein assembly factor BamB